MSVAGGREMLRTPVEVPRVTSEIGPSAPWAGSTATWPRASPNLSEIRLQRIAVPRRQVPVVEGPVSGIGNSWSMRPHGVVGADVRGSGGGSSTPAW